MADEARKDQLFVITYISEERPDPSNLSLVRAVQKQRYVWAIEHDEARRLFEEKKPKGTHYVVAVSPAGVGRESFISFTEEERRRVAGSTLIKA